MTTIVRGTAGLVFDDEYDRNADPIGNGWTEYANPATILASAAGSGSVQKDNVANTGGWQRQLAIPTAAIVQTLLFLTDSGGAGNQSSIRCGAAVFGLNMYDLTIDHAAVNEYLLRIYDAVGLDVSEIIPAAPDDVNNKWWVLRMVWRPNAGATRDLRAYSLENMGSEAAARTTDLGIRGAGLTASALLDFATFDYWSNTLFRLSENFYSFLCGRNITVQGVPAGRKVRVDARPPVTSTGADIVIDVDAWALPATTIEILTPTNVVETSLTPAGGIFGGDIYQASEFGPLPAAGAGGRTSEFIPGDAVIENTLTVGGVRYIAGAGAPTLAAPRGSEYFRTDGPPWIYINETPGVGWVAKIV